MNHNMLRAATICALLPLAGLAQATIVFSDNFDANSVRLGGLNQTPSGWTVTGGTIDLVGAGTLTPLSYGGAPTDAIGAGHGKFIDLDGSLFNAGVLSQSIDLLAGTTYTLSFELAGKHRLLGAGSDSVAVSFGDASLSAVLGSRVGWTGYSLVFTPSASQAYSFSFANAGGDNYGALLDNVSVTAAVPEPQTYALMGAGLLAMLMVSRRRQRSER
jgi:hypothetical protein